MMNEHLVASPAKQLYDVEAIRRDFPILSERPYGKPLVYLDNAASAQKPRQVIERISHMYEHEYANVHRGLHYLANAATDAFEGARETVRRFLNAEIRLTRSSSRARRRRRSILPPSHMANAISKKATRSFSPRWSTTPTSCRGTFCANAKAPC